MTLMDTMCVVEAFGGEPMGQKKGKIVSNDQIIVVDPNLLAQFAGPARTPKFIFVIRLLAQVTRSRHLRILFQVMH
jgi:hypothetical protein